MEKDFDIIFVDANPRLIKNWAMIAPLWRESLEPLVEEGVVNCPKFIENRIITAILRSFMYSIRKLSRAYSSNKIVLLWDKGRYHNAEIIERLSGDDSFKADRVKESDPVGQKLFHLMNITKYYIINNYEKFGVPSIVHTGYEADILARIASLSVNKKSALCTVDSDWKYILSPNCPELINMNNMRLTYYKDMVEECLGEEPWVWNIFHSSFYGSHNNLKRTVSSKHYKREFEEIREELFSGTNLNEVFDDWQLLVAQVQSWNYEGYPEYDLVKKKVETAIEKPISFAPLSEFLKDIGGSVLGKKFYDEFRELMGHKEPETD